MESSKPPGGGTDAVQANGAHLDSSQKAWREEAMGPHAASMKLSDTGVPENVHRKVSVFETIFETTNTVPVRG